MITVLIHWKIRNNQQSIDSFLSDWKTKFVVQDRAGLVGEFLSEVGSKEDFPYLTWSVGEPDDKRKDFVNVGLWADEKAFHEQIGKFFNDERPLLDFEYERRVRTVLRPKCWRIGRSALPMHDSDGTL